MNFIKILDIHKQYGYNKTMLKIRDKVTINAESFSDKQARNGVVSRIETTEVLDTGLFTLGLLHFYNSASLEKWQRYVVVYELPARGDKIRLVFRDFNESELTKGWIKK